MAAAGTGRRPENAQTQTIAFLVLLDRRRGWRPIDGWACSAPGGSSRARKSPWPWPRFVAICDTPRSWPRKVGRRSFPAPSFAAPRPSLRNTAPKSRSRVGRRDLTSSASAFFARQHPEHSRSWVNLSSRAYHKARNAYTLLRTKDARGGTSSVYPTEFANP